MFCIVLTWKAAKRALNPTLRGASAPGRPAPGHPHLRRQGLRLGGESSGGSAHGGKSRIMRRAARRKELLKVRAAARRGDEPYDVLD